jgi:DNA-binding transcriptional LysR family regulator
MDTLPGIAVFAEVVQAGSFTAAAERLEISKAVVSKHVSRLEQRLGARLFHRTTRRLTLTEAGEALYRRSAPALAELEEVQNDVAQLAGAPRGRLRVSAPTYFGTVTLAPLLKPFLARYPEVMIDVDLDDRIVDLVKDRFDVAIRIAGSLDASLVARRLATDTLVTVASPGYFRSRARPNVPADIREHACLGYTRSRVPNEWRFRARKGPWIAVTIEAALYCNNDFLLKQAALDGLGIALFPRFFVARELTEGMLVEALPGYDMPTLSINAVYATRRHVPVKVRAFVDFLVEALA